MHGARYEPDLLFQLKWCEFIEASSEWRNCRPDIWFYLRTLSQA